MRPRRAPEVVSHWRASERAKLARLHRVSPLSGSSNTPHVLRQYAASVGPASTVRVSFCLFAAIVASSRRNRRCSLSVSLSFAISRLLVSFARDRSSRRRGVAITQLVRAKRECVGRSEAARGPGSLVPCTCCARCDSFVATTCASRATSREKERKRGRKRGVDTRLSHCQW